MGVQGTGGAVSLAWRPSWWHPWDLGLGPERMNGAELHKLDILLLPLKLIQEHGGQSWVTVAPDLAVSKPGQRGK